MPRVILGVYLKAKNVVHTIHVQGKVASKWGQVLKLRLKFWMNNLVGFIHDGDKCQLEITQKHEILHPPFVL